MGRLLIVIGLVIAAAGLLMVLGIPLGRLPGDISYRRGTMTVYFPVVTCVVVSVVLSLVFALLRR